MERFDTFYYTASFISDKRTLSLLSILSDSVYLYHLSPEYFLKPMEKKWEAEKQLPFFQKAPIKTDLITPIYHKRHKQFIEENTELINAGVIRPIPVEATPSDWGSFEKAEKRMLMVHTGIQIFLWGSQIGLVPEITDTLYVDAPHFIVYRWQSFSGALYFAIKTNITPISDNSILSSIAYETVTKFSDLNIKSSSKDLAKLIGFKALSTMLPNFGNLEPERILEIRDDLRDELTAFRYEMYQIASQPGVEQNNLNEIVKLKIEPRVNDIKLKITSAKKALHRKIGMDILAAGTSVPLLTQFVHLPTHAQIATGVGLVGKMLIDYFEYSADKKEILSKSKNKGLVLLLDLEKEQKSK